MDPFDPVLSHQPEVVSALSMSFRNITVITAGSSKFSTSSNIGIVSTSWQPREKLRSIFWFYRKTLPVIFSGDFDSVFFHMTDVQCALISPLLRIMGKKQVLWYAHTSKSNYLKFASFWVSTIATSTVGSCPIRSPKVKAIGQGVNPLNFPAMSFTQLSFDNLIHIGRFDKSKNIDLLISSVIELRKIFAHLNLVIIGSPANSESESWASQLIASSSPLVSEGWLHFAPAVPRSEFPKQMRGKGCFFHAYTGSLDKTLIESTMMGVPVITVNPEYLRIFGSWSSLHNPSLIEEFIAFRATSKTAIEGELSRRLSISIDQHSLANWVTQLTKLIQ